MMKEVGIFAVSTSALAFFLFPPASEPKNVPEEVVEIIEAKPRPIQNSSDGWDYDDADEDSYSDENFVFGEPLVSNDDDYSEEEYPEADIPGPVKKAIAKETEAADSGSDKSKPGRYRPLVKEVY